MKKALMDTMKEMGVEGLGYVRLDLPSSTPIIGVCSSTMTSGITRQCSIHRCSPHADT